MFILKDFLHWLFPYRLKLILLLAAAVWGAILVWPASKLTLVFCSVGQGDAAIVSRGFTQVVIDAGPSSAKAADCLNRRLPFFDRRLEAVIISHPQTDHFGGLPAVLNRYQVDKFIFNGFAGDSRAWVELSRLVEKEGSQIITLAAGDKIKIGEIEIDVLWPEKSVISSQLSVIGFESAGFQSIGSKPANRKPTDQNLKTENRKPITASVLGVSSSRNLNSDALVLKLTYGEFSALFTGDIGEREEKQMVKRLNGQTVKRLNSRNDNSAVQPFSHSSHSTVLKVPHHGSKTSSSAEFLAAVRPALAVIEVGKNSYGHPADEVLERLNVIGAKILRTDRDGDIMVGTDGKKWNVILPPCPGILSKLLTPACRF